MGRIGTQGPREVCSKCRRVTFWRTCGNESWDFGPKSVGSDLTAVKWQTINDARAWRRRVSVARWLTFRGAALGSPPLTDSPRDDTARRAVKLMRPGEGVLRPQRPVTEKAVAERLADVSADKLPHQHRMTAQPDDLLTG
jgi:hypothetical protein